MRVNELMTTDVQTVPPTMAAATAWEMMRREGIHHLIVRADGEVVGVLSDRDAGGRRGAMGRGAATVADFMTRHVVSVHPQATVRRAANLMRGRSIGCLPVVDDGRTIGIVTVSDLLAALGRGIDRPTVRERVPLNHRVAHHKQHRATGTWQRRTTPLIVGEEDRIVIDLNRAAMHRMHARVTLEVVAGATHLFQEPGALERVSQLAVDWCRRYMPDVRR